MADNKMQIFTDQDIIPIENGGTGATTLDAFVIDRGNIDNFNTTTLSNITTNGNYYVYDLSKFTDKPSVDSSYNYAILTVEKTVNYVSQTLVITVATNKVKIFRRFVNTGGAVTNWVEIFTTENVIPIANGGTGMTSLDKFIPIHATIRELGEGENTVGTAMSAKQDFVDALTSYSYKFLLNAWDADCDKTRCPVTNSCWWQIINLPSIRYEPSFSSAPVINENNATQIWFMQSPKGSSTPITSSDACRIFMRKYKADGSGWDDFYEIFTGASTIPIENGGTGATDVISTLENLGLSKAFREKEVSGRINYGTSKGVTEGWYTLASFSNQNSNAIIKLSCTGNWEEDLWIFIGSKYFSSNSPTINIIGNSFTSKISKFRCNCSSNATTGTFTLDAYIAPTEANHYVDLFVYWSDGGAITLSKSPTVSTTTIERAIVNHSVPCGFESSVPLKITQGGTGATTADAARENLLAQRKVENVTYLELGASRTSAGNAYIDFHSNKGTDYDARIIVDSNKILQLQSSAGVRVSDMNNGGIFARNIQYSTKDLTAGSSALTNGQIYLVYE